jgi:ADP-ribosylglycohydrolase
MFGVAVGDALGATSSSRAGREVARGVVERGLEMPASRYWTAGEGDR